MNLVIVESPTKAKTISRFLGKDYRVLSSFGHVRDLPSGNLGVDVKKDYEPSYSIPRKANKALKAIRGTIKSKEGKIEQVILATDEDREGEAIAYHLKWIIEKYAPKITFSRIVFHEITPRAIKDALKHPREIDTNLFNAQQARRVLDRLVGYNLSPLLWKKIRYGLSAGRVQSVALRLVVEKERERDTFKSQDFWTIEATLRKKDHLPPLVLANLTTIDTKKLKKLDIETKEKAETIKKDLEKKEFKVIEITKKEGRRYPDPPYRTSTLQRDAATKLGFSAKQTMLFAQKLYEGIKLGKDLGSRFN